MRYLFIITIITITISISFAQVNLPNNYASTLSLNKNVGIGINQPQARLHINTIYQLTATGSGNTGGGSKSLITNKYGPNQLRLQSKMQTSSDNFFWDIHNNETLTFRQGQVNGSIENVLSLGKQKTNLKTTNLELEANRINVLKGNLYFSHGSSHQANNLYFGGNTAQQQNGMRLFSINSSSLGGGFIDVKTNNPNHGLRIRVNTNNGGTERMLIKANGKVGIGTNKTPNQLGNASIQNYRLFVKGGILTEELRLETNWADYVFDEEYDLPTLEEVKKHINEKGYLPGMPSAEEIESNGMEVGHATVAQQEKIEELFLYIIDQQNRLEELTRENLEIKAKLKDLEKIMKKQE